jgi:putative FmdB family regulatory protein
MEMPMPLFEYSCKKCGAKTEFLEKIDAAGPHPCGKCGSAQTEKAFSSFSARVVNPAAGCPSSSSCAMGSSCRAGGCPMN